MATATERYQILQNIIAQKGISDVDLWSELAKVESMINGIDQSNMMPPPVPPEIMTGQPTEPTEMPEQEMGGGMGRYDNL